MKEYIIYLGTIFLPDKNAAAQRAMMICKSYRDVGLTPIIVGVSSDLCFSQIKQTKALKDYETEHCKSIHFLVVGVFHQFYQLC